MSFFRFDPSRRALAKSAGDAKETGVTEGKSELTSSSQTAVRGAVGREQASRGVEACKEGRAQVSSCPTRACGLMASMCACVDMGIRSSVFATRHARHRERGRALKGMRQPVDGRADVRPGFEQCRPLQGRARPGWSSLSRAARLTDSSE